MKTFTVKFDTVDNAASFVKSIEDFDSHFDLIYGKYVVDAQSILGVMTMNLRKAVDLRVMERNGEMEQIIEASLCQVNVGNYSFFFMTNIFSFKTAVIDGSFRLSPLVCLLAARSSFCQGQSHMWCSAPLTENCSDSLSVIKRTMPFLVLPYIFLTIERSHKCLGRRTLHCVQ